VLESGYFKMCKGNVICYAFIKYSRCQAKFMICEIADRKHEIPGHSFSTWWLFTEIKNMLITVY